MRRYFIGRRNVRCGAHPAHRRAFHSARVHRSADHRLQQQRTPHFRACRARGNVNAAGKDTRGRDRCRRRRHRPLAPQTHAHTVRRRRHACLNGQFCLVRCRSERERDRIPKIRVGRDRRRLKSQQRLGSKRECPTPHIPATRAPLGQREHVAANDLADPIGDGAVRVGDSRVDQLIHTAVRCSDRPCQGTRQRSRRQPRCGRRGRVSRPNPRR